MENATQALKIAFAMFVFILAMTIIFIMVGQAKSVADSVMYYTDKTNFYSYKESGTEKRVSIDQVICSLYNYNKENVCIEIYDKEDEQVAIFDLSQETGKPWTASNELIEQRISLFIYGKRATSTQIGNGVVTFSDDWFEYWPETNSDNEYPIARKPLFEFVEFGTQDYFVERSWVVTETVQQEAGGKKITKERLHIEYHARGN